MQTGYRPQGIHKEIATMVLSEYYPPHTFTSYCKRPCKFPPPAVKVISFYVDFGDLHVSIKIRHRSARMENITPQSFIVS